MMTITQPFVATWTDGNQCAHNKEADDGFAERIEGDVNEEEEEEEEKDKCENNNYSDGIMTMKMNTATTKTIRTVDRPVIDEV